MKQLDNRGSSFYIARYWAEAMAKHDASFTELSKQLIENESTIVKELLDCQGLKVDIGGYWKPDPSMVSAAMRPSTTFNNIINKY